MQHGAKENKPVKSYLRWIEKISEYFYLSILKTTVFPKLSEDPFNIKMLKHYHSLAPMSMEVRKPIFELKPADGAIGAHFQAVQAVYADFKDLCEKVLIQIE